MTGGDAVAKAHQAGRKADNNETLGHAVRVGLVSYGIVHLLIAWLALQLALGDREGSASKSGALHELAARPFGQVLMWVVGLGFVALVLWQLIEAAVGHREEEGGKRLGKRLISVARAAIYGSLGFTALKLAIGADASSQSTDTMTAKLMSMPFGALLVGVVGVAVVAYAVGNIYQGLSESFTEHLTGKGTGGDSGTAIVTLGKVGYVARGLAFLIVGGLFLWAAFAHDPKKSGGLDSALLTVLEQPYGAPMLIVMALGIGCFGVYCFAWARHLDR
ncbi:MAG: DUF1206 domain-containing protein [Actinomycetes bacterium]